MSSKCKISLGIVLALIAINCSEPDVPKKGITRYYITKLSMPDDWEDQFHYANDTLIDQIQLYNKGKLINTQRPSWNADNSLSIEARGYLVNEVTSIRRFTFTGAAISSFSVANFYPNNGYKYDFSFDSQGRLDSYVSSFESGAVTWLTDSLSVLQTTGTKSKVFGVNFEEGASPWSGLSTEALVTLMFQEINIIECFVPGKINALGSSSYGYYKYDEYVYDADNNLTSLRRTDTATGKVEFFKLEWKKVLL